MVGRAASAPVVWRASRKVFLAVAEEQMVELMQDALAESGISDVVAVGQFSSRGQTGVMLAGGLIAS
jgi:hypothetical protein